jgi:FkbM family methyltransferase
MAEMTLPNGYRISHVDRGEAAYLYDEIFTRRCYVRHGIRLHPGDVVFDVGANIGMATLFFHLEQPRIRIHAFEPAPQPFEALRSNIRFHQIDAAPHAYALSDQPGSRQLIYYPRTSVMSGLYADPVVDSALTKRYLHNLGLKVDDIEAMTAGKYKTTAVDCAVTTVSRIIREAHLKHLGLLKIDVEKSELDVLRGIEQHHWPRIGQVVVEVHDIDDRLREVTQLLEGHGFSLEIEQDVLLRGTDVYSVFAVRRSSVTRGEPQTLLAGN